MKGQQQEQPAKQQKAFIHMPPMRELSTEEARQNPFPILKELREKTPVRFDAERGVWDVFMYEDCVCVFKDPHTFSTNLNYAAAMSNAESLMSAAPARHREIRNMVDKAFTPKSVQKLVPRIKEIAHELLDRVVDQGRMNTVHDFTAPLPVIVIAELLGVPASDRMMFKEWSDAMLQGVYDASEEAYQEVLLKQQQARADLRAYFQKILDQRKVEPQDDLISAMWALNEEEKVISEDSLLNFFIGLLVAGNETTTNLIGHGVKVLTEQPELQEQLANDPSLIPSFVEEVLRYYPPATMLPRLVTEDVELSGQQLQAGDMCHVWVMSANRDPAQFEQPDTFVIDRANNKHITFGFGIHFCLGAPLARVEAQVAFEAIIERLGHIGAVEGVAIKQLPFPMFVSFYEFPVVFEAKSLHK